jgi:HEAT repeat protein
MAFLVATGAAWAQPSPAPAGSPSVDAPAASAAAASATTTNAPAPADDAAKLMAKRRDTIRYGIDSEVTDLIKDLTAAKDGAYNDDLFALLQSSNSAKLRSAVLDFFDGLEWRGAEQLALGLIDDRDNQDADLVSSALAYLAAIRSKEALRFADPIVKEDNKKLLPGIVRLMGRAGGEAEVDRLLGFFDSDTATPALKEEAIKALGEIGSAKASDRLGKLILDTGAGKAARMYACDSLGKIKDPSSVAVLVKAANDADPNVRCSAIDALGVFAGGEAGGGSGPAADSASKAIAEALRDSYVKARIEACKAAASGKVQAALPFLRYKAQSDPEKAVRSEACRSLAAMGDPAIAGDPSFAFLRERLEDQKEEGELRVLCFGLLARYDPVGSLTVLQARLLAEQVQKDRSFYTALAREIANADKAPGVASLARILLSDQDYLIRVAGIEWIRKNKALDMKADLDRLAATDPSDLIKRRAADALKVFQ